MGQTKGWYQLGTTALKVGTKKLVPSWVQVPQNTINKVTNKKSVFILITSNNVVGSAVIKIKKL
jgi:hypothetical protein